MDRKARKFVQYVLLVHLLLLIVVAGVVIIAARDVYKQSRAHVLWQAMAGQELLADQTADGIETLYDSIRNDLDMLHQSERDDAALAQAELTTLQLVSNALSEAMMPMRLPAYPSPTTRPVGGAPYQGQPVTAILRGQVNAAVAALLWRQLESRTSLLFVAEVDELDKYAKLEDLALASKGLNPPVRQIGPQGSNDAAVQVAFKTRSWLKGVTEPAISKFQSFGGGTTPGNLVCFPASEAFSKPRGNLFRNNGKLNPQKADKPDRAEKVDRAEKLDRPANRRLIVAVVPIEDIEKRFLRKLNDNPRVNASIADEGMVTMVSSDPALVGVNAAEAEDPRVRELAKLALSSDKAVTLAIEEPYVFGHVKRQPRLFTMQPVDVLSRGTNRGRTSQLRWWLMVSTPLSEVDDAVSAMFRKALLWTVGVVVSMTAILVSTAIWLIRGRMRLERVQHELLTRELSQAREIQLAWLPRKKVVSPLVDVAAHNTPASHISGDFYNWFELPDGRLVVTLGDVTGHGMSAAFLMSTTQLLVRTTMMRVGDPGACLDEVNRQLCTQVFIGQFVSILLLVIDLKRGEIQISSAGHYPPLVSTGGAFQPMNVDPSLVLGVEQDTVYGTETFELPPGASLLMYTDGVLDALNPASHRFKDAGLRRSLELPEGEPRFENAQAMINSVVGGIDRFRGPVPLPDDLTMVALQLSTKTTPRLVAAVSA